MKGIFKCARVSGQMSALLSSICLGGQGGHGVGGCFRFSKTNFKSRAKGSPIAHGLPLVWEKTRLRRKTCDDLAATVRSNEDIVVCAAGPNVSVACSSRACVRLKISAGFSSTIAAKMEESIRGPCHACIVTKQEATNRGLLQPARPWDVLPG